MTDAVSLATPLLLFGASSLLVIGSGVVLAREGDQIAHRTKLGGIGVGAFLLAGATSLPEIATDISASLADAPDLAVGDLFGSSMANMAILAVIDLIHRGRVWPSVGIGHARLAAVAIALTSMAVLGILAGGGMSIGWVGVVPVAIATAYAAAALWMRRTSGEGRTAEERPRDKEIIEPIGWAPEEQATPLRIIALRFAAAALVVLVSAPVLAVSAKSIADQTGIGQTFVGTVLLAATTSLPELVASLAAVRIGAYDLAVGNLFGSNAFNMVALLAADIAYLPGPILAVVESVQAIAGIGAILLMALALMAVVHGARTRLRRLEPDALLVLITWVALLVIIYANEP
jgi:cation:H+ antiporter